MHVVCKAEQLNKHKETDRRLKILVGALAWRFRRHVRGPRHRYHHRRPTHLLTSLQLFSTIL